MKNTVFLFFLFLMLWSGPAMARDQLVVKNLTPQNVDKATANALSDVIKDTLSQYYEVQSMEDLAAITGVVEEKLKAGCDDTQCIMDVAGAMNIDRVVFGSISRVGKMYRFSLRLVKSKGDDAGVKNRAFEKCSSEDELFDAAERVALELIGKSSRTTSSSGLPGGIRSKDRNSGETGIIPLGKSFTNTIGQKFVYIEPGSFMMGSPSSESGRDSDETRHRVSLTKGYYMQTTEVTQRQWQAVMGNNPSNFSNCSDCPVEQVNWNDAQEFIRKLNQKEGTNKYRLPTEAEWEYACRAGTTGRYAGSGSLDSMGWYNSNSGNKTHPVGQKQPNAWGLYDMHGNVWEWVQDRCDWKNGVATDTYVDGITDPVSNRGSGRVFRGGGWYDGAGFCRSAIRDGVDPGYRSYNLGFRLAGPVE